MLGDADVKAVAKAHGVSAAQVALRWVAQQGVLVLTSATNPEYLREDMDIFGFALSGAEMALLARK